MLAPTTQDFLAPVPILSARQQADIAVYCDALSARTSAWPLQIQSDLERLPIVLNRVFPAKGAHAMAAFHLAQSLNTALYEIAMLNGGKAVDLTCADASQLMRLAANAPVMLDYREERGTWQLSETVTGPLAASAFILDAQSWAQISEALDTDYTNTEVKQLHMWQRSMRKMLLQAQVDAQYSDEAQGVLIGLLNSNRQLAKQLQAYIAENKPATILQQINRELDSIQRQVMKAVRDEAVPPALTVQLQQIVRKLPDPRLIKQVKDLSPAQKAIGIVPKLQIAHRALNIAKAPKIPAAANTAKASAPRAVAAKMQVRVPARMPDKLLPPVMRAATVQKFVTAPQASTIRNATPAANVMRQAPAARAARYAVLPRQQAQIITPVAVASAPHAVKAARILPSADVPKNIAVTATARVSAPINIGQPVQSTSTPAAAVSMKAEPVMATRSAPVAAAVAAAVVAAAVSMPAAAKPVETAPLARISTVSAALISRAPEVTSPTMAKAVAAPAKAVVSSESGIPTAKIVESAVPQVSIKASVAPIAAGAAPTIIVQTARLQEVKPVAASPVVAAPAVKMAEAVVSAVPAVAVTPKEATPAAAQPAAPAMNAGPASTEKPVVAVKEPAVAAAPSNLAAQAAETAGLAAVKGPAISDASSVETSKPTFAETPKVSVNANISVSATEPVNIAMKADIVAVPAAAVVASPTSDKAIPIAVKDNVSIAANTTQSLPLSGETQGNTQEKQARVKPNFNTEVFIKPCPITGDYVCNCGDKGKLKSPEQVPVAVVEKVTQQFKEQAEHICGDDCQVHNKPAPKMEVVKKKRERMLTPVETKFEEQAEHICGDDCLIHNKKPPTMEVVKKKRERMLTA